jgi:hypothetical protein
VKCPHCFAIGADTDRICYACKQPLAGGGETSNRPSLAMRIATIGACLGACIAPYLFGVDPMRGGTKAIMLAGAGGCLGGTLGLLIGSLIGGRRS